MQFFILYVHILREVRPTTVGLKEIKITFLPYFCKKKLKKIQITLEFFKKIFFSRNIFTVLI